MGIILPLEIAPPFKTFSIYANKQGIMLAQNKNAIFWIMAHYLDLEWDKTFSIIDCDISFFDQSPLHLFYYNTFTDLLIKHPQTFKNTIKSFISNGMYLWGYYNEIAIHNQEAYKQYDLIHDYFIYGFSDEDELFSIGYSKEWEYKPYCFSFDEFIDSLIRIRNNTIRIMLIKPNKNFDYRIDWEKIYTSLKNFLKSYHPLMENNNSLKIGLNAQNEYLQFLCNGYDISPNILIKNSRLLMEYKSMIHKIIKLHPKYKEIESISEYHGLYRIYEIQHMLSVKYFLEPDSDIIKRIILYLREAFEREKTVLENLIEIW